MAKEQLPEEWYGTRTVIRMQTACGFCRPIRPLDLPEDTSTCTLCPHETAWYDKLWICGCACNDGYEPTKVVVERPTPAKKEKTNAKPKPPRASKDGSNPPDDGRSDSDNRDGEGPEAGEVSDGRVPDSTDPEDQVSPGDDE